MTTTTTYSDAVFQVEGNNVLATAHAAGPWDQGLQHGGAPTSLAIWAAERIETPSPMQIARVSVDLLRPVPIGELTMESEIIRAGRKIQLCGVRLLSKGVEVVRASVLKVRRQEVALPEEIVETPLDLPLPEQCGELPDGLENNFVGGITLKLASGGGFGQAGPSAVWFCANRPIVEGHAISPAMRAGLTADFSNGVSSVLSFADWTFINGDLTVSLAREPVGDWVLLNAETWLGPSGGGIAAARLSDRQGYFGRAVQSLVIEKR